VVTAVLGTVFMASPPMRDDRFAAATALAITVYVAAVVLTIRAVTLAKTLSMGIISKVGREVWKSSTRVHRRREFVYKSCCVQSPSTRRHVAPVGFLSFRSAGKRLARTLSKLVNLAKRSSEPGTPTAVNPGWPVAG